MKYHAAAALAFAFAISLASCAGDATNPTVETTLLSVTPSGGDTQVDRNTQIDIEFSHPMQMNMFVALHVSDMSGMFGPLVDGSWSWSQDRMHLMFAPAASLDPQTEYTIHIGGGMQDADGRVVDMEQHGHNLGGQWIMQNMMQGCMMNVCGTMMGPGWQHANGSFGMSFTFMTQ
jgi:hypothetical protein